MVILVSATALPGALAGRTTASEAALIKILGGMPQVWLVSDRSPHDRVPVLDALESATGWHPDQAIFNEEARQHSDLMVSAARVAQGEGETVRVIEPDRRAVKALWRQGIDAWSPEVFRRRALEQAASGGRS